MISCVRLVPNVHLYTLFLGDFGACTAIWILSGLRHKGGFESCVASLVISSDLLGGFLLNQSGSLLSLSELLFYEVYPLSLGLCPEGVHHIRCCGRIPALRIYLQVKGMKEKGRQFMGFASSIDKDVEEWECAFIVSYFENLHVVYVQHPSLVDQLAPGEVKYRLSGMLWLLHECLEMVLGLVLES
ncbi:uncharacterized protein LOC132606379 [Lycium barbarum]|uniref:uncharacterized protein LOC132606379 n=1 Tax=Lycium barbarum TaxID=112863 RepID=UPI00293F4284|nr:uncharacterized protein LOC132606379 [Lycium barbarum]